MNKRVKNQPNFSSARLVILVVVILVGIFSVVFIKELLQKKQLDTELAELNQELENLKIRKKSFLSLLEEYQSNFYAEQESRSKLNLKKDGEKVVVVKLNQLNKFPQSSSVEAENLSLDQSSGQVSTLELWWRYFFGENQEINL